MDPIAIAISGGYIDCYWIDIGLLWGNPTLHCSYEQHAGHQLCQCFKGNVMFDQTFAAAVASYITEGIPELKKMLCGN